MTDIIDYPGQELDLFAHAQNWKRYWSEQIHPFLIGDVLEVGAGLGTNTPLLHHPGIESWTCLEPDPHLAARLEVALRAPNTAQCRVVVGTLESLQANQEFDTIIYIDVLEHIEHDAAELQKAAAHLRPGGAIVVLSPAHQSLYTPFDKSIGHFRRYNKASLRKCTPPSCSLSKIFYLDSAGLLASLGNKLLLQQATPALKQILVWDNYLVPFSRTFDRLIGYRLGKSIVGIWRKNSVSG